MSVTYEVFPILALCSGKLETQSGDKWLKLVDYTDLREKSREILIKAHNHYTIVSMEVYFDGEHQWARLPERPPYVKMATFSEVSRAQKRVDTILADLLKSKEIDTKSYQFRVFPSKEKLILHTRWRIIYLPTALVTEANTKSKLALVIGHEIGHWQNGDMKNDSAKIPISNGYKNDRECLADATSERILKSRWSYSIPEIQSWKKSLEIKYRRPSCG